jgi:predicted ABC-type ATPase
MELYVIAGPNGAGKTTFARKFLPKYADCNNFVNADLIAAGVSPFSPESAVIRAGRLMLSEIRWFSRRRTSFGFETTLSGRSNRNLIEELKQNGYEVHLFFLTVSSVDIALSRIKQRVLKGGHDIPEEVVRRRFTWSMCNFFTEYRELAQAWYLFDNTSIEPSTIAFKRGDLTRIIDPEAYQSLIDRYGQK